MLLDILREQEFCDRKIPIRGKFPSVQNKLCVTRGGGIFIGEH